MEEKIELLSCDLFKKLNKEMETVEFLQKDLKKQLGWHYPLDLAWTLKEIENLPKGSVILDAGAGGGLLQFILARLGYNVLSADFAKQTFPPRFLNRFGRNIHYLNDPREDFDNRYTQHLKKTYKIHYWKKLRGAIDRVFRFVFGGLDVPPGPNEDPLNIIQKKKFNPDNTNSGHEKNYKSPKSSGKIFLYKCDLKEMSLLPDDFVDGVVSISALEHNDHKDLEKCIDEIMRVTKPGGKIVITVSASLSGDWFHEPSKGWCYSEESLKKLFKLPGNVRSNFREKDKLFEDLKKENNPLHNRLAPFYYRSGDNGMPWGKWDPKYQPVGVVKIKKKG